MDTIKINKGSVKMIAHRGVSWLERENTNAAFVAAGNRSYYGMETDVYRTLDGKFVLFHDRTLWVVAGVDMKMEQVPLADLQSVVLYDTDKTKTRFDLRVSTPQEYLSICKKYQKHSVIELKSDFTEEEIAQIIEMVKAYDHLEDTTFIAFSYENLRKVRKILPQQPVQLLSDELTEEILDNVIKDKIDVSIYYELVSKELVDFLHEHGIKVNCWTVDNKEHAEKLVEMGVDYITTDILE